MNENKINANENGARCDENKFCHGLAQTFRATFEEIKYSPWCRQAIPLGARLPHVVGENPEDKENLEKLIALLPDLKLPAGTSLRCVVNGDWSFACSSAFYFVFSDGSRQDVKSWSVDVSSARAVWEKTLIVWASDQFCLSWHAGYSQERIILDQTDFDCEIAFSDRFTASLDDASRKRFEAFDFKPKATLQNGMASIRYYTFSPFGGIYERVATEPAERSGARQTVFPFNCGIRF